MIPREVAEKEARRSFDFGFSSGIVCGIFTTALMAWLYIHFFTSKGILIINWVKP